METLYPLLICSTDEASFVVQQADHRVKRKSFFAYLHKRKEMFRGSNRTVSIVQILNIGDQISNTMHEAILLRVPRLE